MTADDIREALGRADPAIAVEVGPATDQPTLIVGRDDLVAACRHLHDAPALGFRILSDVTAVDYWPTDPRFEVVYHLASESARCRLRLKVRLGGDDARVGSLVGIWPGAAWLEREVWDLFGVTFAGNDDLTRLLTPEDWEGHPLRKDYPAQIDQAVKFHEPLQLTEDEFRQNIADDRAGRRRQGPFSTGPR